MLVTRGLGPGIALLATIGLGIFDAGVAPPVVVAPPSIVQPSAAFLHDGPLLPLPRDLTPTNKHQISLIDIIISGDSPSAIRHVFPLTLPKTFVEPADYFTVISSHYTTSTLVEIPLISTYNITSNSEYYSQLIDSEDEALLYGDLLESIQPDNLRYVTYNLTTTVTFNISEESNTGGMGLTNAEIKLEDENLLLFDELL